MRKSIIKLGLLAFTVCTLLLAGTAPISLQADTTPRPWNPRIINNFADTTPRPWNPTIINNFADTTPRPWNPTVVVNPEV